MIVDVGQVLVVTLPNPSEREIARETVKSSNLSVLQLVPEAQPVGQFVALLRVPFRAIQVGSATVTATGMAPFALKVEVVSP